MVPIAGSHSLSINIDFRVGDSNISKLHAIVVQRARDDVCFKCDWKRGVLFVFAFATCLDVGFSS